MAYMEPPYGFPRSVLGVDADSCLVLMPSSGP